MADPHRSLSCPRCSGSMEPGYTLDEGYGTRTVAKWVAGEPERSKAQHDVVTYRCRRCGYLESYA